MIMPWYTVSLITYVGENQSHGWQLDWIELVRIDDTEITGMMKECVLDYLEDQGTGEAFTPAIQRLNLCELPQFSDKAVCLPHGSSYRS
jgi:hypothetical protein